MAVARLKIFAVEILTASDLNAEFSNITDNGEDLAWPASKAKDFNGNALTLDADGDSQMVVSTDDRLDVLLAGTTLFRLDGTVATPVNGIDFIARATGSPASIQAQGADANVGLDLRDDNGNELLVLSAVASAVNELTVTNAATGNAPILKSSGEANTGLQLQDSNGGEILIGAGVASAVNEVTLTNAVTTASPQIAATGDDSNIGIELRSKGTGDVILADDGGNEILIADDVASAVNEITVTNAITTAGPSIAATGDDTDIDLNLVTKGTGQVDIGTGGATTAEMEAATAVDRIVTPASLPDFFELETKQATTSGTAFDFTGIRASAKQIIVMFEGVSLSGADNILVQIGDSGGFEATGYISTSAGIAGSVVAVSSTSGFIIRASAAGDTQSGLMMLTLIDSANFTWISSYTGKEDSTTATAGGGDKSLSDTLTQVRITRSGSDTFDAGAVNILIL